MDGAGFTAPMVLPGTYTIKLKIKDKEYTSTVKCVHDVSNKDLSEVDRKLVYEKAILLQSLYNSLNNLAFLFLLKATVSVFKLFW